MLFLVLLCPPEGVELPMLGDHSVPLGLSMDNAQDTRLLLKRVPSMYKHLYIYNLHNIIGSKLFLP